jgi:hypothetical protein
MISQKLSIEARWDRLAGAAIRVVAADHLRHAEKVCLTSA